MSGYPLTDADLQTMQAMREQGHSVSDIARELKRPRSTIRDAVERLGYIREREQEPALYQPRKAEYKKLYKAHPHLDGRTAEMVLADIREEGERAPHEKPRVRWIPPDERHMAEFCIFDAHIGKLAWAPESGDHYDTDIAVDRVHRALDDLLYQARGYAIEKVLLPIGNDFLHYDALTGQTTAGTPQDRDSRYQKMYRAAFMLARHMVDECVKIAPVEVVIVPGNHDTVSTFTLGVALEAFYDSHPSIVVNNTPRKRKYVSYGQVLLGFAHGDKEPVNKLPSIMPVETVDLWGASRFREFHLGHFHTSKRQDAKPVQGENGVRLRYIQSLTGVDAWHAEQGYIGEPGAAEAFIWHAAKGLRANLFSHVLRDAA
jgi:predicted transcriptional regulator